MSSGHLLFVDDEMELLELYRTAFAREGYEVSTAATLDEARSALHSENIDVVILDIRMTEGSGLHLLRELKVSHPELPVILNTAFARYQDEFTAWLANAYVVKSSDLTPLRQVVRQCLEEA